MLKRIFQRRPSNQENIAASEQPAAGKAPDGEKASSDQYRPGSNPGSARGKDKGKGHGDHGNGNHDDGKPKRTESSSGKKKVAFGERTENGQTGSPGSRAGSRAGSAKGAAAPSLDGSLTFSLDAAPIVAERNRPGSASTTGSWPGKPPLGTGSIRAGAWRWKIQQEYEQELAEKKRREDEYIRMKEAERLALEMADPNYVPPKERALKNGILSRGMARLFPAVHTHSVHLVDEQDAEKKKLENQTKGSTGHLPARSQSFGMSSGSHGKKKRKQHKEVLTEAEEQEVDLAKQQTDKRRGTTFLSKPKVASTRWRGVGIEEPAVEGEVAKSVSLVRASEVSKHTKLTQAVQDLASNKEKIGTVNLKLLAAKGIPRVNDNGTTDLTATVRVYSSEATVKPYFEHTTEMIRVSDPLARTLKADFGEEFHLEIHDALALVEVELESVDNAGSKHALGMIKAVIPDIPQEESDQWWMLRLKDGAPKTTQLNVSMFFEKFVEDATQRRLRLRSMREAKIKNAAADAPGWISAWDVRAVKNYEDEVMEARKIVMIALADGGLPKVAAAARRIKELSMQHEEKSKALLAMHKELKENAEEEARLIKRMQELSAWPKDNKQWLSREIRIVLIEADKIGMTNETPEIVDMLELLAWTDSKSGHPPSHFQRSHSSETAHTEHTEHSHETKTS